jgi:predicted RNA methylase
VQTLLMVVIAFHVLPGVFWAGTTLALARTGGAGAERLAYPQMGAATVAMLAGVVLWGLAHRFGFGATEQVLALGAGCAILAAGVQGFALPAVRRLATARDTETTRLQARIATAQRIAAGLLAITVICMAVARYV